MLRIALMALAGVMLLLGAISMVTPIPGGTFLIASSLTILICTSKKLRKFIGAMRAKMTRMDRVMTWLEDRMGKRIGDAMRLTRPAGDMDLPACAAKDID